MPVHNLTSGWPIFDFDFDWDKDRIPRPPYGFTIHFQTTIFHKVSHELDPVAWTFSENLINREK